MHVDYVDHPTWATWQDLLSLSDEAARDKATVFTSYHGCLDYAERGEGIALGWERSVKPRIEAGTLVRIPGITKPNAGVINAYLPINAPNPHATEFVARLKDALALE